MALTACIELLYSTLLSQGRSQRCILSALPETGRSLPRQALKSNQATGYHKKLPRLDQQPEGWPLVASQQAHSGLV